MTTHIHFPFQLTFEEFKLGRFRSFQHNGCPDGHLQIRDGPRLGGQYCGIAWANGARPVYISENGNVSVILRFYQFYGEELENNFSFRLRYKFLDSSTARIR